MSAASWPGCHGVRLTGETAGLGTASGHALAVARVQSGKVAAPDRAPLWTQRGVAVVDGDPVDVDRSLFLGADGGFVVSGNRGPRLAVDLAGVITVDAGEPAVRAQLVASFALPLVLQATPALVVHASACSRGEDTVVVCGQSGAGKSSLLVGLVDAGWLAVSEDLCTIDLRGAQPMVWPGPPWVRVARGRTGPRGSRPAFEGPDKTGWDLSGRQTTEARPLTRLVFLEPPGGDTPSVEVLTTAAALGALAGHAVWLGDQEEGPRRLFPATARVASRVTAARLRLPRRRSWLDQVPDILATG